MDESKPCKSCGQHHKYEPTCPHNKPTYENDCLHCIYLGHFYDTYSVTKISADLYFCDHHHERQLVAILDNERGGTVTHLESIHNEKPFWTFMREARKRAVEDGLIDCPMEAWLKKNKR